MERRENVALPSAKRMRLVMKEEHAIIHQAKQSKEGTGHEENPDVNQLPNAVPRGNFNQVQVQGETSIIAFDLQTTDFIRIGQMPHITQIAARNMETGNSFNQYVRPGHPITAEVQRITRITVKGSSMTCNGMKVESLNILEALQQFCSWLDKFNRVCLVAHNGRKFDFPVLINALVSNGLKDIFLERVIACCDSLAMFRKLYPGKSLKQENLARDILGETYDAHNAMADVETLIKLIQHTKAKVLDYTFSPDAVYNNLMFNKQKNANIRSLCVLVYSNICKRPMAENIAGSGLNIHHLKSIYLRSGEDGLRDVFTETNSEGQPRVTKVKKVLDEVVPKLGEFFSSEKGGGKKVD